MDQKLRDILPNFDDGPFERAYVVGKAGDYPVGHKIKKAKGSHRGKRKKEDSTPK